jgi:hypothetical protein
MAVLLDVASCSLVDTERRFRGAYCFHRQGDYPDPKRQPPPYSLL